MNTHPENPTVPSAQPATETRGAGQRVRSDAGSVIAWHSCAQWPDGLLSFAYTDHNNTTRDRHDTEKQAEAVCALLSRFGLGGERIHFPVKTWTEPIVSQNKCSSDTSEASCL